jgi:hypothetical protein
MSNRLSKGKVLVGSLAADGNVSAGGDLSVTGTIAAGEPGFSQGGIAFTAAGTTAVTTAFQFALGSVIDSIAVKITSVSSSTNTISFGLATGATSQGVGTVLTNALSIPSTGTYVMCASTGHATLSFSYGSYLISSTSEGVTILKQHVVGSTDTYQYLNYTCATTAATVGVIYPFFYELS